MKRMLAEWQTRPGNSSVRLCRKAFRQSPWKATLNTSHLLTWIAIPLSTSMLSTNMKMMSRREKKGRSMNCWCNDASLLSKSRQRVWGYRSVCLCKMQQNWLPDLCQNIVKILYFLKAVRQGEYWPKHQSVGSSCWCFLGCLLFYF